MGHSNLIINSNCVMCGSCLGCGFPFLSSSDDGSICVVPGTMLDKNGSEISELQSVCPVDAFEISDSKRTDEVITSLLQELRDYQGIKLPTRDDVVFNAFVSDFSKPWGSGECEYNYRSESSARSAGLDEFYSLIYSQLDNLLLKAITEYRVQKLKPYYSTNSEEGSVYSISNKKVSELLLALQRVLGNDCQLPSNFSYVELVPDSECTWGMLNQGEVVSGEFVSEAKRRKEFNSSDYKSNVEVDSFENPEMSLFGKWKTTTKYSYSLNNAFWAFREDIEFALNLIKTDIEEAAVEHITILVEAYNRRLKGVIAKKIRIVKSAMNSDKLKEYSVLLKRTGDNAQQRDEPLVPSLSNIYEGTKEVSSREEIDPDLLELMCMEEEDKRLSQCW